MYEIFYQGTSFHTDAQPHGGTYDREEEFYEYSDGELPESMSADYQRFLDVQAEIEKCW
jgi:hypothetical protein